MTWAINGWLPGQVAHRFRDTRIVVFATRNVYPFTTVVIGGSVETDTTAPVGEYAMSCFGRERLFQYMSHVHGTMVTVLRLNYAVELRHGVLVDVAQKILKGEEIAVGMGGANVVWEGNVNAMALQSFAHASSPPFVVNIAGPEQLRVRGIAEQLGLLLDTPAKFSGTETETALLSNGQLGHELFVYPRVSVGRLLKWVADWVGSGTELLDRPPHFETREGRF